MDMDFDVNDVGADVIPGCYVLNIGIKGLERSKFWIRADYIRVYNYLETINDGTSKAEGVAPSAIITGQPGIGKSVWVYYVLRRRLEERKPVIWYRDGSCLLFVEEGVYQALDKFRHPASTNSSGLFSIPTNPRRAFLTTSFHRAPAYS